MTPSTTIHLLPQEELSSLLARLEEVSSEQVVLVIPEVSIIGQSLITLQLLADRAIVMHKNLQVSSQSAQVEQLAKRAGLKLSGDGTGVPEHGFMAGADIAAVGAAAAVAAGAASAAAPTASALPDYALDTPAAEVAETPTWAPAPSSTAAVASSSSGGSRFKLTGWKLWTAIAVAALLIFGGLYYILEYVLPHATVTVMAEKQTMDRDVAITVDPTATKANVSALVVPGTQVTATSSKSQTFPSTGKKDIGDKATGKVSMLNHTDNNHTFAAGTIITSGGKQFLLNASVTVESATVVTSTDPITHKTTTVSTPGSADVNVTAGDIGEDYNLKANSSFTVAKFDASTYEASNTAAFSGGTKKSVTVVSADDQADALEAMQAGVSDEATKALKEKVPADQELLTESVSQKVTSKEYSQKVGDQVDNFSLTLEVEATGMAVDLNDVKAVLKEEIASKVPEGYTLDSDSSKIENHVTATNDDGSVTISASYVGQVVPDIDTEAMKKAIAGKDTAAVGEYLKSQPNIKGYDIVLSPNLPGPFHHLPKNSSHIKIVVKVEE